MDLVETVQYLKIAAYILGGLGFCNLISAILFYSFHHDAKRRAEEADKILSNVIDYASLQRFLWNYDTLSLPIKEELYQRLRNDRGEFAKARTTLDKLFEKYAKDQEIIGDATRRSLR